MDQSTDYEQTNNERENDSDDEFNKEKKKHKNKRKKRSQNSKIINELKTQEINSDDQLKDEKTRKTNEETRNMSKKHIKHKNGHNHRKRKHKQRGRIREGKNEELKDEYEANIKRMHKTVDGHIYNIQNKAETDELSTISTPRRNDNILSSTDPSMSPIEQQTSSIQNDQDGKQIVKHIRQRSFEVRKQYLQQQQQDQPQNTNLRISQKKNELRVDVESLVIWESVYLQPIGTMLSLLSEEQNQTDLI